MWQYLKSLKGRDFDHDFIIINNFQEISKYIYNPNIDEFNNLDHSKNFDNLDIIIMDGD